MRTSLLAVLVVVASRLAYAQDPPPPDAPEPAPETPAETLPPAEQPPAEQPATHQPATEQPATEQPATEQPAEPAAEPAPAVPADVDPTKPDDMPDAPLPDQASGIATPEPVTGEGGRMVVRGLLFVPRWTFWLAAQPIRGGAWAFEEFQLERRIRGVLFNWDGTYGIYPVGSYSSDFGFDLGVRFVHKNLFGKQERLKLRANFGGRFQQGYGFDLRSGERFGKRINVALETLYERRPNERFFGIGNANEIEEPPPMLIDPTLADTAITSRFRENWFRSVLRIETRIVDNISARLSGALALRDFANYEAADPDDPTDPDDIDDRALGIESRFDTSKLVGYDRGVDNVYIELEVGYDTRRPSGRFQPPPVDSTGWYITAHGGRAFGVGGDPTAFWRFGGEVQKFFDLYRGSRILTLRTLIDAVYGGDGRTDSTISFIDLPRLGGTEWLRGYPDGRFRDRAVTLSTVEYSWDLGNFLGAYLFVDAGRAWSKLQRFDPDSLHVGYGGGVQLHTNASFLMRAQLAFSREGDAFAELVFSPAFGRRERAGRY